MPATIIMSGDHQQQLEVHGCSGIIYPDFPVPVSGESGALTGLDRCPLAKKSVGQKHLHKMTGRLLEWKSLQ